MADEWTKAKAGKTKDYEIRGVKCVARGRNVCGSRLGEQEREGGGDGIVRKIDVHPSAEPGREERKKVLVA